MFFTETKLESIKKWVKSHVTEKVKELTNEVVTISSSILKMKQRMDKMQITIDELNHIRNRKDSDEPWFEIYGGDVNEEHGLELRLDWNDAFISQLKLQGYKGTSDDELIAQYIANVQKMVEKRDS